MSAHTNEPLSIPGKVVVFDYGEVISRSPSEIDRAALLAVAGATPEEFWPAYDLHRGPLDQGLILPAEYWALIASELGREWPAGTIQSLWAADFRSWTSVEPGTVELIARLHAGGTRVALLSNAGFDFAAPFRISPFSIYFERMFVSAEMGLLKPAAEIYEITARELGIDPVDMVFIDNKLENVEGAQTLGVTGHHFTGVEGLSAFLESLASERLSSS